MSVRATLARSLLQSRVVVTIASTRGFTARSRPRSVTIRYRRATYRLRRVARPARAGAAAGATSVWQSPARARFNSFLGKRIDVILRTSAGTTRHRRTVARPRPPFRPPGRDVKGEEAFRRISRYFVNSRFTDCPEGWPACVTEHRYDHCAGGGLDGGWRSRAFPPTAGLAMSGRYHVVSASQSADGSWGVTYQVALDTGSTAYYSWMVRADGTAQAAYVVGEDVGYLRGYRWQQPAGC